MATEKSKKTVRQISVEMDAGHINRTEQYARQVGVLYDEAVREATRIGISLSAVDSSVPFTFDHYPEVKERVNKMVKSLFNGVNTVIASGTREEWLKSAKKNDAVVDWMLERTPFTRSQLEDMYDRNLEALAAFQKRKINGLGLSEKVWKLSEQFRNDMEMGLDIGLADGRSAAELSRDLRQYLNEPSRLFARIRDKEDSARFYLSENAKRYHPGEGMYRSSYKNALRLTRTEINMAYRTADQERWQQLDFVVGFEVKLSNNHTLNGKAFTDICDELAGKYPKSFKFVGWHPQCRCFVIPILATEQEFVDWQQRRLDGDKAAVLRSGEEIEDIPPAFAQWVVDNRERMENAEHIPYFLKDNKELYLQEWFRDFNDKDVLMKNIRFGLGSKMDSISLYTGVNGKLIKEREELHQSIVDNICAEESTRDNVVYMLGGAPANGKSTLEQSDLLPHPKKTIRLDSDAVKKMFPEYGAMQASGNDKMIERAAAFVHEESSKIVQDVQKRLFKEGKDFVLDGVNDGKFENLANKIKGFKENGRSIRADYVTLDSDLSVRLAMERAKKTGRMVPLDYVSKMNREVSLMFPQLLESKLIDELYLWDTNLPGKTRLILKQIHGKTTIYSPALYRDFLMKGTQKKD